MEPKVQFLTAWIIVLFIGLLAAIILVKVYRKQIDLTKLVSEENGDASMSRFQFMLFTFVVALMWIYVFFNQGGSKFPPLDPSVLGLMGISGGSYVLSKGIQKSSEVDKAQAEAKAAVAVFAPPPQVVPVPVPIPVAPAPAPAVPVQVNVAPQNAVQVDPNNPPPVV